MQRTYFPPRCDGDRRSPPMWISRAGSSSVFGLSLWLVRSPLDSPRWVSLLRAPAGTMAFGRGVTLER
eukprot:15446769-Alexandrium_andersonii.AAC.1